MNNFIQENLKNKDILIDFLLLKSLSKKLGMLESCNISVFDVQFYLEFIHESDINKIKILKQRNIKYFKLKKIKSKQYLFYYFRDDCKDNELDFLKINNIFSQIFSTKKKFSFLNLFLKIFETKKGYLYLFFETLSKYEFFIRNFGEINNSQFEKFEKKIGKLISKFETNQKEFEKYYFLILLIFFKKEIRLYESYITNKFFTTIKETVKLENNQIKLKGINFDENYQFNNQIIKRYHIIISFFLNFEKFIQKFGYKMKFFNSNNQDFYETLYLDLKKYDYLKYHLE